MILFFYKINNYALCIFKLIHERSTLYLLMPYMLPVISFPTHLKNLLISSLVIISSSRER